MGLRHSTIRSSLRMWSIDMSRWSLSHVFLFSWKTRSNMPVKKDWCTGRTLARCSPKWNSNKYRTSSHVTTGSPSSGSFNLTLVGITSHDDELPFRSCDLNTTSTCIDDVTDSRGFVFFGWRCLVKPVVWLVSTNKRKK